MITKSRELSRAYERLDKALEALGMRAGDQNEANDKIDAYLAKKEKDGDQPSEPLTE